MAALSIRQLYSRRVWLSDGTDTVWNFGFTGGYIDKTHVKARMVSPDGLNVEPVLINYATDFIGPYQLQVLPAIPAGWQFTIYRDTPKDVPIVNFQDGGRISEVSLDVNSNQAVFIAAEALDAVLDSVYTSLEGNTLLDDEFGYKSMRQVPYTGASVVGVMDNGRAHYKTDGSSVSVPTGLRKEFMTTIVNNSAFSMSVTFAGTAYLQGPGTAGTTCVLAARNLMSITQVETNIWFVSGKATIS